MNQGAGTKAQAAYLATVRAQDRGARNGGYIACLIGVMIMLFGRYNIGAPGWTVYAGLAVILVGWGLLAFSIFRRAAYVRAHPFLSQDS